MKEEFTTEISIGGDLLGPTMNALYRWDFKEWVKCTTTTDLSINKDLSIVTWNIWFGTFQFEKRYQEICRILCDLSPDFICLQEVTKLFIIHITKQEWVKKEYYISDCNGSSFESYGVFMLCKYPSIRVCLHQFPNSFMNRNLLTMEIDELIIATTHLESLDFNRQKRIEQLEFSLDLLKDTKKMCVFCGDFNFGDKNALIENTMIEKFTFVDAWCVLNKDTDGFTMPATMEWKSWRPDRILFSPNSRLLTISKIGIDDILYDVSIKFENHPKTPSDHYGLFCTFRIQ